MPEAAVDEYDEPVTRENQVGLAGQIWSMKAEAEPRAVNRLPHSPFRQRILAADSSHITTARWGRRNCDSHPF
jgi:hypothetical protein